MRRGEAVSDHFVQSSKVIAGGKGARQNVVDVLLSRYAAYLVVMNGDPKMPIVAMGQDYFAKRILDHMDSISNVRKVRTFE